MVVIMMEQKYHFGFDIGLDTGACDFEEIQEYIHNSLNEMIAEILLNHDGCISHKLHDAVELQDGVGGKD